MAKRRIRSRGFTLIELMLVVAILGLLSTIAIPAFQDFVLKSKRAEKANFMKKMVDGVFEYYGTHGAFPLNFGSGSMIDCPRNPPAPVPDGFKHPWVNNSAMGHWNDIMVDASGDPRFHYEIFGYMFNSSGAGGPAIGGSNFGYVTMYASSDLDFNGVYEIEERMYFFSGTGDWELYYDQEYESTNAPGQQSQQGP